MSKDKERYKKIAQKLLNWQCRGGYSILFHSLTCCIGLDSKINKMITRSQEVAFPGCHLFHDFLLEFLYSTCTLPTWMYSGQWKISSGKRFKQAIRDTLFYLYSSYTVILAGMLKDAKQLPYMWLLIRTVNWPSI